MGDPVRIQRSRKRGWVTPTGVVNVCRPTPWGNPFIVSDAVTPGKHIGGVLYWAVPSVEDAVECYRLMIEQMPDMIASVQQHLRGKTLMCWCALDAMCHADVLLRIANAPLVCEVVDG